MIPGAIETITGDVLSRLVSNGVPESRTLEYKRDLPGGANEDKKEFLADVTAFANTIGGDLIYGVDEAGGIASAADGVVVEDKDAAQLRLEQLLRDGVEPRLASVRMHWVALSSGAKVLIVRVGQSLSGPHRIKFQGSGRFVARGGAGKYDMDTHQLRDAFSASEALPDRLRALHLAAVRSATTGADLPFRIHDQPMAIVSLIPYSALRQTEAFDVTPENALAPVKAEGHFELQHLIEGILLHSPLNAGGPEDSNFNSVRSYALTHRRGRIDAAWTVGGLRDLGGGPEKLVWPLKFEEGLIDVVGSGVTRLRQHGIEGPWFVAATVSGLAGGYLVLGAGHFSNAAWRDSASLGDLIVEHSSTEALTPLMNAF